MTIIIIIIIIKWHKSLRMYFSCMGYSQKQQNHKRVDCMPLSDIFHASFKFWALLCKVHSTFVENDPLPYDQTSDHLKPELCCSLWSLFLLQIFLHFLSCKTSPPEQEVREYLSNRGQQNMAGLLTFPQPSQTQNNPNHFCWVVT